MKESRTLEFKEAPTNSFLKTVSAFANYGGGTIIFGINDDGNVVGLADPKAASLSIENKINDSISPQPAYSLAVDDKAGTVTLVVHAGANTPYLYRAKAYRRNDTATIEVDSLQMRRLVLRGQNLTYDGTPSGEQSLTFHALEEALKERVGIESFNNDVLRSLNLYSNDHGYNIAAELLADKNNFPGIDIAKFGESINVINKRLTLAGMSVLTAYDRAVEMYADYYQHETIDGAYRTKVEVVPEEAFREAVANAIAHRAWDVRAHIRVAMFEDRIEVTSPGGLPEGITEQEYLAGRVSVLRNPILAGVLFRLNIIEAFGTGIPRIMRAYEKSLRKPVFEVSDNAVLVILPLFETDLGLSADEREVYACLSRVVPKSMSEVTDAVSFSRTKAAALLKSMVSRGLVTVEGMGRGTRYRLP